MAKFIWQARVFDGSPLFASDLATQITVIDKANDLPAPIWLDEAGTSLLGNPFYIDEIGKLFFYVNAGKYKITATNGVNVDEWDNEIIGPSDDIIVSANVTASYEMSADNYGSFTPITGSGAVVISVPSGLIAGKVHFVKVDEGFTGSCEIVSGTGSPTVNPPLGKTLDIEAGGCVAIFVRSSSIIDVFGDSILA